MAVWIVMGVMEMEKVCKHLKKTLGFTIKCPEIKLKLQWKFGTEIEIKFILMLIAYVSLLA